jgi:hypothetical protein
LRVGGQIQINCMLTPFLIYCISCMQQKSQNDVTVTFTALLYPTFSIKVQTKYRYIECTHCTHHLKRVTHRLISFPPDASLRTRSCLNFKRTFQRSSSNSVVFLNNRAIQTMTEIVKSSLYWCQWSYGDWRSEHMHDAKIWCTAWLAPNIWALTGRTGTAKYTPLHRASKRFRK